MKEQHLLRAFSQYRLNLLPSLRPKPSPYRIIRPTLSSSRLFSSKTPDPSESSSLGQSQNSDGEFSDEELRKQVDKLVAAGDGDAFKEAFPTVFEGLMKKILAGKSDEEIKKEMFGRWEDDDKDSDTN